MWFKKGLTIFALSCALTVGVSAVNSAWAANKGYVTVKEIENNSPKIEIQMPQLKDHELQDKINAAIEQPINAAMTSYRELTEKSKPEWVKRYTMLADYDVKLHTQKTFSIVQRIYQFTGGAHGIHLIVAQNFNMQNGKQLDVQ